MRNYNFKKMHQTKRNIAVAALVMLSVSNAILIQHS